MHNDIRFSQKVIIMELTHIAVRTGRLSAFLTGELKMSAGLMNKLKWGDAIRVNGQPRHTDFAVQPGDVITVRLDEPRPDYPAQQGNLAILFEDDWLLAVDKPAGMLIHPSRAQYTGTLANFVAGYFEKTGQCSAFHPLTRLDRDTFGIVLLAKNAYVHTLLQQTAVQKIYHARTLGVPPQEQGVIDAPIVRKPLPSLLREVGENGKRAVTEYRVLEQEGMLCKLELRPITGRTHQLRVHCAHMGFPILGDPQYGTPACMEYGWRSQALCAKRLEFCHPITGEKLTLSSVMDVQ